MDKDETPKKWKVVHESNVIQYRSETIHDVSFYDASTGEVICLGPEAMMRELIRPDGSRRISITLDTAQKNTPRT